MMTHTRRVIGAAPDWMALRKAAIKRGWTGWKKLCNPVEADRACREWLRKNHIYVAQFPDGRFATRKSDNRYTHAICACDTERRWSVERWTAHPERLVSRFSSSGQQVFVHVQAVRLFSW